ncbi:hypothetical protein [Gordonia sp. 1D]|uniref:hypothetical protein n=1 Tax=Gordonia sp. 1D TaxID=1737359 RepID=UPI0012FE2F63|nr:hypothetical protein [Gordonia sp. 1D]
MTAQQEAQRATMLADILREVRRITPHRGRADVEVHMREISARYVRLGGLQLPKRWQTIEQLDRIALRIRAGGATSVVEAISQLDHEAEIRRLDAANDDARWRSAQRERDHQFRLRMASQRSADRNARMVQGAVLDEGIRARKALRQIVGRR